MSENANAAPGWYPGNGEKNTACVTDSKAPAGQETSHPPKMLAQSSNVPFVQFRNVPF